MKKTITLSGYRIDLRLSKHAVHIDNSKSLCQWIALDIKENSLELAEQLIQEFHLHSGRPLDISPASLAVEIIGHVYAGHLASVIEKATELKHLDLAMKKISDRCAVIDAGEPGYDVDRRVWDLLSPFLTAIAAMLQREAADDSALPE